MRLVRTLALAAACAGAFVCASVGVADSGTITLDPNLWKYQKGVASLSGNLNSVGSSPSRANRPVSGAFTLDLDKIESAVDNIGDTG